MHNLIYCMHICWWKINISNSNNYRYSLLCRIHSIQIVKLTLQMYLDRRRCKCLFASIGLNNAFPLDLKWQLSSQLSPRELQKTGVIIFNIQHIDCIHYEVAPFWFRIMLLAYWLHELVYSGMFQAAIKLHTWPSVTMALIYIA